jgi:antitoxin MazE
MPIARWGNSLGVRLPKQLLEQLDFHEGDAVVFEAMPDGRIAIGKDLRRSKAIAGLAALNWDLPSDFRFDRAEIYDRKKV